MTTRWQPTRAGILNVWRYYDEVFTFHDGRLLLRGPNGSGKSKALELLLPFLFDANLSASRLSTFAQGARSMHWNLMGQGASGTTRVGFVWLELVRDEAADERFLTIGARLQASRSETRPRVDYFLADGRVGVDFELTADQTPLTAGALREQLVGRGTVFATAGEYRAAVRQTVFPTMTPDRYETLIGALLQLRRPKLSEHLDPAALSSILSSALPPVDAAQIQELAEGFERLDQQRAHLVGLDEEVKAARAVLDRARAYGRAVLRERARAVTGAATRFDSTSRDLRLGAERLEAARSGAYEALEAYRAARRRLDQLMGDRETLSRSEDYRSGEQLEELRRRVHGAEHAAEVTEKDARWAAERSAQTVEEARALEATAATARAERTRRDDALRVLTSGLGVVELVDAPADLRAWLAAREDQVAEIGRLVDVHDDAVAERTRQDEQLARATDAVTDAREVLREAERALELVVEQFIAAVGAWAMSRSELEPQPADVQAAARDERLTEYVAALLGEHLAVLAAERALLSTQRGDLLARLDELVAERKALAAAGLVPPPAARFRTAARDDRSGAPLWRVVDFRDEVSDDERAAVEAALEASGLLDAWVTSSGEVWVDGHDVLVGRAAAVSGPSLADVLTVDAAAAEQADLVDAVRRVLTGVGLGASDAGSWVAVDGRWRLGVTFGSWSKAAAQYVGAAARERNRQERLAALEEQITAVERAVASLDAGLVTLAERETTARRDAEAAPSGVEVPRGRQAVESALAVLGDRETLAAASHDERDAAQRRVDEHAQSLALAADRLGLPTTRSALTAVRDQVADTRHALDELVQADRDASRATASAQSARSRADEDASHADELATRAESDRTEATVIVARLAELQEVLGAGYERAATRMRELETEIGAAQADLPGRERASTDASNAVAKLEERSVSAEAAHEEARLHRAAVSDALVAVVRTSLARDAGVAIDLDAEDRVRAVLEAARRIDRDLPERANDTVASTLNRLTQRLFDAAPRLGSRALLELEDADGFTVPTAATAGRRIGMQDLLDVVEDERTRAGAELTEAERALFEQALTGDTRRHLSAMIRDAHELVERMNERLASVRTASDVSVRLRWEVRDDEGGGMRHAQSLLLKDPARLVEEERQALHDFFRARIDQTHAEDAGGSWAQQLATVFDYTAWHQFRVEMNRGDDQGWRTLTRQAHGVLSGGEKAIALHLPLFAALAAHYEATPLAPRLILLDEVFVGIDSANRGQIFALLGELDLDLVLTSDHEWATYPEVAGIAIHALAAGTDDDEAVTTTRFVWNGRELAEDPSETLFA